MKGCSVVMAACRMDFRVENYYVAAIRSHADACMVGLESCDVRVGDVSTRIVNQPDHGVSVSASARDVLNGEILLYLASYAFVLYAPVRH